MFLIVCNYTIFVKFLREYIFKNYPITVLQCKITVNEIRKLISVKVISLQKTLNESLFRNEFSLVMVAFKCRWFVEVIWRRWICALTFKHLLLQTHFSFPLKCVILNRNHPHLKWCICAEQCRMLSPFRWNCRSTSDKMII